MDGDECSVSGGGESGGDLGAKKKAYVVVVGDLGRSPRMRNHALSLASEGYDVTMVGYLESKVGAEVESNSNIAVTDMPAYPHQLTAALPRLLNYVLKVIWQTVTLWLAFPLITGSPDYILLQNPPGIPALLVCYAYSVIHGTTFVLDWHNYGYSIMALTLGEDHPLVRLSKVIEKAVGARVKRAFCVSNAMKDDLRQNFGVEAVTLYDRAKDSYRPITVQESHNLFVKLGRDYAEFRCDDGSSNLTIEAADAATVSWRTDRPAVLVSSTSWTEDEDFSILVEALQSYEEAAAAGSEETEVGRRLPELVCVITGKGPLKEHYCGVIRDHKWKHVKVVTPWLEPEDYPLLLASADLGVSLHTSSSGVDLPMKVVDMFGCGLPVAAKRFAAIGELVKDNQNGVTFDTSKDLATIIIDWFTNFASKSFSEKNARFRESVALFGQERWSTTWVSVAKPLFN